MIMKEGEDMKFSDIKFVSLYDGKSAVIPFGKYELSIVSHQYSYGGDKGLYEIAVFNADSNDQVELPGITNEGDTVKGFLTESDVVCIIKKMVALCGS
jgi:hypothetical protein